MGFKRAGLRILWANDIDKDACETFEANHPRVIHRGDLKESLKELSGLKGVHLVFGGPPCQGFSVAGKMDPKDERSTLLWSFLDVVAAVKPNGFVCENVKALGRLKKWADTRSRFIARAKEIGYGCAFVVLDSSEFGVPQRRERVFFIGVRGRAVSGDSLLARFEGKKKTPVTVRQAIQHLGPAGTPSNEMTCKARITMASNPIMRKSPYAGMMFNGLGRPMGIDGFSATLPASMGGNKTPIIDEANLHGSAQENWIIGYHKHLQGGGETLPFESAPARLRRLTIKEAALIQTFPPDYKFKGSKSSIYQQIGNAVPCSLAEAVAKVALEEIEEKPLPKPKAGHGIQGDLFTEIG